MWTLTPSESSSSSWARRSFWVTTTETRLGQYQSLIPPAHPPCQAARQGQLPDLASPPKLLWHSGWYQETLLSGWHQGPAEQPHRGKMVNTITKNLYLTQFFTFSRHYHFLNISEITQKSLNVAFKQQSITIWLLLNKLAQCTLGSLTDKNSRSILHFQC